MCPLTTCIFFKYNVITVASEIWKIELNKNEAKFQVHYLIRPSNEPLQNQSLDGRKTIDLAILLHPRLATRLPPHLDLPCPRRLWRRHCLPCLRRKKWRQVRISNSFFSRKNWFSNDLTQKIIHDFLSVNFFIFKTY